MYWKDSESMWTCPVALRSLGTLEVKANHVLGKAYKGSHTILSFIVFNAILKVTIAWRGEQRQFKSTV